MKTTLLKLNYLQKMMNQNFGIKSKNLRFGSSSLWLAFDIWYLSQTHCVVKNIFSSNNFSTLRKRPKYERWVEATILCLKSRFFPHASLFSPLFSYASFLTFFSVTYWCSNELGPCGELGRSMLSWSWKYFGFSICHIVQLIVNLILIWTTLSSQICDHNILRGLTVISMPHTPQHRFETHLS